MGALTPSFRAWIVPGLAGSIAVAHEGGPPHLARVWAARVIDDSDVIELCVQRSSALSVLGVLDRPRRASLNLIEVTTYRSRAFKGACELSPRTADPSFVDACVEAAGRAFHAVGMSADAAVRMLAHGDGPRAMVALRLAVESVFDQSPKPGAGARL